ncbi:MAG: nuclear transport factor 2 family protein [Thermomicrobium sp.]|nr:nuclear transport factor 2 family protein [Thermomicrobium sp.]
MERALQQPARLVVSVGGILLVLVLLTVVAVLLVERRSPPSYPPGSPEQAVVAYLEALRAGDREAVLAALSSRAREELERRERLEPYYDFDAELRGASQALRDARVRIDRVEARGDRATVTLTIERASADLQPGFPFPMLGGGTYSYERLLSLVREDGAWKVDELAFYL